MKLSSCLANTAFVLALGLSACAAAPPSSGATTPAAGACDTAPIAWTIGQVADDALVERARVESHSTSVRVLRPGMLVTNDHDGGRLNIRVDNERRVLSVECG
jgi:hypothetical protein